MNIITNMTQVVHGKKYKLLKLNTQDAFKSQEKEYVNRDYIGVNITPRRHEIRLDRVSLDQSEYSHSLFFMEGFEAIEL